MAEYGKQSRVACIGPAGEKLSLIAGIMTDHGSAAGRSGLGAVMGSKKLKAVVARGTKEVDIADKAAAQKFIVGHIKFLQIASANMGCLQCRDSRSTVPAVNTYNSAHSGDSPG